MALYRLEWKSSACRDLKRLDRQVVPRIIAAVESLADDPFAPGTRKLHGVAHTYRMRVGDYRIIYEVFESHVTIHIVRVRHRRDAYRR
jgi:mRNA interferase RelE/StbE